MSDLNQPDRSPALDAEDILETEQEPTEHNDVGRLVQPENEIDEIDTTAEEVAFDSGDDGALSAEEAAMHITEAPPMGDGDGYLEEDNS